MSPIADISFAPWSPIPLLTCSPAPQVGKCLAEHKAHLRHAVVERTPALTDILNEIWNGLREHPLLLPRLLPVSLSPRGFFQAVYSTARHPRQKTSHQYLPPPPLQASVSRKQNPSKKKGHHPSVPPSSHPHANAGASKTYRQHRSETALKIPRAKDHRSPTPVEFLFIFVHHPKLMRSPPTAVGQ